MPSLESLRSNATSARQQGLGQSSLSARRTLYIGALVWLGTATSLWVVGWVMARCSSPPKVDPAVAALFVPWAREAIAPEPDERRMYIVLTLLSPLLILAAWAVLRRVPIPRWREVGTGGLRRGKRLLAAAVPAVLLLLGLGGAMVYHRRTAPIAAKVIHLATPDVCLLVCGVLVLWVMLARRARWRREAKAWPALALAGSLALAVAGSIALRVFDERTAALASPVPLNTVLYCITQAAGGQHALADFVPQYGCYAEFLKPCFALIGLSVFHITAVLAALQCLSFVAVVWTFSRLLRSGWVLLLGAAALAWLPMCKEIWGGTVDPYYQYFPVRVLFPALSLVVAWLYLSRPSMKWSVAAGILGGLAVWWNVDSGAVTLASLLGLLLVKVLVQWGRSRPTGEAPAWQHLLAGGGAAALAMMGFYLWLCLEARQWIDLGAALRYQKIFYVSGFYMLRMPATLSPWHVLIGVYLLALTVGLGSVVARRSLSVGNGMVLYLGVLGIGLFSYYQGRSHPAVLELCCWPGVLLALLLGDRMLAAVRYGLIPRWCAVGALPALVLAGSCALGLWRARGKIDAPGRLPWQDAPAVRLADHVPREAAYIERTVPPGESCAFVSPYQALYYASTGLRPGLTGESIFECLLQSDVENLVGQLKARKVRHLFTEFYDYPTHQGDPLGPEFFRALADSYRLTDIREDGLWHWEPRSDAQMRANPADAFRQNFNALARLDISPDSPRHTVRFQPTHWLLDHDGRRFSAPYDWGAVSMGDAWAFEILLDPAATQTPAACVLSNRSDKGFGGFTFQQADIPAQPNLYAISFGNGRGFTRSKTFFLAPEREHYVAVSCEANVVSVFVDGEAAPPFALEGAVSPGSTPLTVGDWIGYNLPFHGEISEVKWHDRPLSADAIARTEAKLRASAAP